VSSFAALVMTRKRQTRTKASASCYWYRQILLCEKPFKI